MDKHSRVTVIWMSLLTLLLGCSGEETLDDFSTVPNEVTTPTSQAAAEALVEFEEIKLPTTHTQITEFVFLPNSTEFLLIDQPGEMYHYNLSGDTVELLGSFTVPSVHYTPTSECGLQQVAVDPDFESNQFIFVAHCISDTHNRLARLTFDPNNYANIPSSAKTILEDGAVDTIYPWHNTGSILFDSDKNLIMFLGEKAVRSYSQDPTTALGGAIRLSPNRDPSGSGYTEVSSNPFFGHAENNPLLLAYGLRNVWKGIVDSSNRLWMADVGANRYEELNVLSLDDTSTAPNYGWPRREGPCTQDCDIFTDPFFGWDHLLEHEYVLQSPIDIADQRRSIYIALEYLPGPNDRYEGLLDNVLVVGDFMTGWVRGIKTLTGNEVSQDFYLGNLLAATGWEVGSDGYIYVVTYSLWSSTEGPNSFFRMKRL